MRDYTSVVLLVTRAQAGDQQAWNALVERYAPLVWSICRRYQLSAADAQDAGQNVWLRLVDQIGHLRDPAAVPGWLATTTRRECTRVLRARRSPSAVLVPDAGTIPGQRTDIAEQELLTAGRHAALREAFTDLPAGCQRLIVMLLEDPPVPYAKISVELGIPIGSIGPTRGRCLDKLRRHPAIAALVKAGLGELGNRAVRTQQRCYPNDQETTKARSHLWVLSAQSPQVIGPEASRAESSRSEPACGRAGVWAT